MNGAFATYFLTAMLALTSLVSADQSGSRLKDNKQELDGVKRQLQETRGKIDSLKSLEDELQKAIAGYGDRVSRNRVLVDRMGKQLQAVRKALDGRQKELGATEERLVRIRAGYAAYVSDYYRRRRPPAQFVVWDYDALTDRDRMTRYLATVSNASRREISHAGDSARRLTATMDSLSRTGNDLSRVRKEKQSKIKLDMTMKQKEESSLGTVRHQTTLLQDRLVSLSEMARQMEEIVATLEREQAQRRQAHGDAKRLVAGSFAGLKGRLRPPVKGRIVSTFGWTTDKITKLKSFSPGIDITATPGNSFAVASAPGRVVYVGRLRGYDNFVILEHDDGYYTTYSGLKSVLVEDDELAMTGDPLGEIEAGKVHFEIRKGREHLDPVIWLNLDEF